MEEIPLDSPEGHSQSDSAISFGMDVMENTNHTNPKLILKDWWSEQEHLWQTRYNNKKDDF